MYNFKHFTLTMLCLLVSTLTWAQTPPANIDGEALRTWLKSNFYDGKHNSLGYSTARQKMYNHIDNKNNTIVGVYSGYVKPWTAGGTGTNPSPINCEHTVPQSFFGKSEPMRSDIHHLFPTYSNWNSARSNYPFAEIDDNTTTKWMRGSSSQTSIPSSNINEYSEAASSKFEPREDHKGNVARAVFYFYTMYPTQAGSITSVGNLSMLYQWHLNDPADAAEIARNNAIAQYQGSRNPYVDYQDLAGRAWGFTTGGGGSCGTPSGLSATSITTTTATLNWSAISGANNYDVQYKAQSASSWTTIASVSGTSRAISGLTTATAYQFQVKANCSTAGSYSSAATFTTTGTSTVTYCSSKGNSVADEWIGQVTVANINKSSGADGGYANYTASSTDLAQGATVSITIKPTWSGTVYSEGYAVWIDFNKDGDFTDSGEQLFTQSATKSTTINGNISIPVSAATGATRMRVSMKYNGVPTSCETFSYGEVEDYTVNITTGSGGGDGGGNGSSSDLFISEYIEGSSYNKGIEIANLTGTSVNLSGYSLRKQANGSGGWSSLSLSGTLANGAVYTVAHSSASFSANKKDGGAAMSFNGNDAVALFKGETLIDIVGVYNSSATFGQDVTLRRNAQHYNPSTTYNTAHWDAFGKDNTSDFGSINSSARTSVYVAAAQTNEASVYPVPASTVVNVRLSNTSETQVLVTNMQGQVVYKAGMQQKSLGIDVSNWRKGIYLMTIKNNNSATTKRLIVR